MTRRGRDGVDQVDSLGVVAALFRQHTSRSMDPQLHTHAVISSKVQDETGKWLALDARFLKFQQRSIGWIYDAALRSELTTRLGVAWEQPASGPVDLVCIPEGVRGVLSKRTGQIDEKLGELLERWMTEHNGDDPQRRTGAREARGAITPGRGRGRARGRRRNLYSRAGQRGHVGTVGPSVWPRSSDRSPFRTIPSGPP